MEKLINYIDKKIFHLDRKLELIVSLLEAKSHLYTDRIM